MVWFTRWVHIYCRYTYISERPNRIGSDGTTVFGDGYINELGVEVQHIPGECTAFYQPVDFGVAKPLKDILRDQWEKWMNEDDPKQNDN